MAQVIRNKDAQRIRRVLKTVESQPRRGRFRRRQGMPDSGKMLYSVAAEDGGDSSSISAYLEGNEEREVTVNVRGGYAANAMLPDIAEGDVLWIYRSPVDGSFHTVQVFIPFSECS